MSRISAYCSDYSRLKLIETFLFPSLPPVGEELLDRRDADSIPTSLTQEQISKIVARALEDEGIDARDLDDLDDVDNTLERRINWHKIGKGAFNVAKFAIKLLRRDLDPHDEELSKFISRSLQEQGIDPRDLSDNAEDGEHMLEPRINWHKIGKGAFNVAKFAIKLLRRDLEPVDEAHLSNLVSRSLREEAVDLRGLSELEDGEDLWQPRFPGRKSSVAANCSIEHS